MKLTLLNAVFVIFATLADENQSNQTIEEGKSKKIFDKHLKYCSLKDI